MLNETKFAGKYTVPWDGKDDTGSETASGLYIVRMIVGDFVNSKKMVKLK